MHIASHIIPSFKGERQDAIPVHQARVGSGKVHLHKLVTEDIHDLEGARAVYDEFTIAYESKRRILIVGVPIGGKHNFETQK